MQGVFHARVRQCQPLRKKVNAQHDPQPHRLSTRRALRNSKAQPAPEARPTPSQLPSLTRTAPADTFSQNAGTPPPGPNSSDAFAIFPLHPHYPRRLWSGNFFRGSLMFCSHASVGLHLHLDDILDPAMIVTACSPVRYLVKGNTETMLLSRDVSQRDFSIRTLQLHWRIVVKNQVCKMHAFQACGSTLCCSLRF